MSNKKKVSYYRFNENQIIFSASFGKRFFARLFDFLIAGLIGKLLLTIYSLTAVPQIPVDPLISSFSEYVVSPFNVFMMIGWTMSIVGIIFIMWIYPLFLNKKYPGQTFGKKLFKITPMFTKENAFFRSFILRESFMSLLLIISFLFILMIGTDATYLTYRYNDFRNAYQTIPSNLPPSINQWNFILNIWNKEYIMQGLTATTWMQVNAFSKQIIFVTWFIILLIMMFSVVFNRTKKGFHDLVSNVVIVDLRTIKNEEEYLDSFKSFTINQKFEEDKPPVILKK